MSRLLCCLLLLVLAGCATRAPLQVQRSPDEVRAEILRKLPASLDDRAGWANDVYVALTAQDIAPTSEHLCAVLAVTEQESTYTADPAVPGLPKLARAEIEIAHVDLP